MRALIHELPYERPIAAGRYQYVQDGQATGAEEIWRLTEAQEGYRFLRVDLNATLSSGDNALYHLVLDAAGRPQRLKFHFFRTGLQIRGDMLIEDQQVVLSREINNERLETQAQFAPQMPFWFPASAGFSLLASSVAAGGVSALESGVSALTLNRAQNYALWPTTLSVREGPPEPQLLMDRLVNLRPLIVRWVDQERTLWLDQHNWPVRVQRGALVAIDKRYVRYAANP